MYITDKYSKTNLELCNQRLRTIIMDIHNTNCLSKDSLSKMSLIETIEFIHQQYLLAAFIFLTGTEQCRNALRGAAVLRQI